MGAVGFTAARLGSVSRWCLIGVLAVFGGVFMVFRWCLGGVSVVSRWCPCCFGDVLMASRPCLGGVSVGSRSCRWCLGGCVDDVSVVSWWCLSGFHVDSRCSRCLVVSWWRRVGRVKKCNVVWYPITSIDQSPWSLSFAGHFC